MREKYRKGIFFVVYRKEGKKIKYLLLKRKLHWKGWEFPKAGVEERENKIKAVERELKEETGLKARKISKFNVFGKYKYDKKVQGREGYLGQTYSLFAVEVKEKKIKIDKKEHSSYVWKNFKDAVRLVTFENQKNCLEIVNMWLRDNQCLKV